MIHGRGRALVQERRPLGRELWRGAAAAQGAAVVEADGAQERRRGPDHGIDLVARDRDTGAYTAIQCKFYEPTHTLAKADIDSFFKIGDVVQGKITKITSFGAFVELKDNIDGLVHISQISEDRIEKVKDVLKPDQAVTARVIKIDREERRLGLSIKAANYSSDQLAAETATYDALNRQSAGSDMMNLGDILDEAQRK